MNNPCETCIERDRCGADLSCSKGQAYRKWKEKAKEIRKHTQDVMRRAHENINSR